MVEVEERSFSSRLWLSVWLENQINHGKVAEVFLLLLFLFMIVDLDRSAHRPL